MLEEVTPIHTATQSDSQPRPKERSQRSKHNSLETNRVGCFLHTTTIIMMATRTLLSLTTVLLPLLMHNGAAASDGTIKRFRRHSQQQRRQSDEWILQYNNNNNNNTRNSQTVCPCSNPQWCHQAPPAKPGGIVLGFSDSKSTGVDYNWTHINAVAWASDQLMCRAHQHGARALLAAPSFDFDSTDISEWVQTLLRMIQSRHFDGVVFDFESPMTDYQTRFYVSLIRTTRQSFRLHHHLSVITCVAWSPDDIDGRNYPYRALAEASDYLYVMDYDTRSQIWDLCVASANAPLPGMIHGLQRYLELGIASHKLILGVPWYGYRYPCLSGSTSSKIMTLQSTYCPIPQVAFRGANCSDAAGSEVAYGEILQRYASRNNSRTTTTAVSPMQRDDYVDAVYFNAVEERNNNTSNNTNNNDTGVYQYWLDDAASLTHKFAWAKSLRLGGIGPYAFDDLDPVNFPHESRAMWSAFDVFFGGTDDPPENTA